MLPPSHQADFTQTFERVPESEMRIHDTVASAEVDENKGQEADLEMTELYFFFLLY